MNEPPRHNAPAPDATSGRKRLFAIAYVAVGALFLVGLTLYLRPDLLHGLPSFSGDPADPSQQGPPVLVVVTEPADAVAAVMIDGRFVGKTGDTAGPLVLEGLPQKRYVLKIECDRYAGYIRQIDLQPGTQTVIAKLEPLPQGTLVVTSEPTHADVTVDGVSRGKTPLELSGVTAGAYTVLIGKTGYRNDRMPVTVTADTTETLHVKLKDETVAHYEDEIKREPKKLQNYVDLAHYYLVNKDFDNLAVWLGAAIALRDEGPSDPGYIGRMDQEINKIKSSQNTYENFTQEERDRLLQALSEAQIYALKKNPDNPAYKAWLLKEAMGKNDLKTAQEILEDGLVDNRDDRTWFLQEYGYKNWRTTVKKMDANLAANPKDFVSLYRKAALYLYAAEVDKAIETYVALLALPQGEAVKVMNLTKLGELYERNRKPEKAIDAYAQAIELSQDPLEKAQLAFSVGVIYQDLGQLDEAIPHYYRAIEYQPNLETACRWRIELAKLQMSRSETPKADVLLTEVLKLTKNERTRHRAEAMRESLNKN